MDDVISDKTSEDFIDNDTNLKEYSLYFNLFLD